MTIKTLNPIRLFGAPRLEILKQEDYNTMIANSDFLKGKNAFTRALNTISTNEAIKVPKAGWNRKSSPVVLAHAHAQQNGKKYAGCELESYWLIIRKS